MEPPPPEWLPVLDRELLERDAGGFDLLDEPELPELLELPLEYAAGVYT